MYLHLLIKNFTIMKKTLLMMAMLFAASSGFAQVQKSINNEKMAQMPEMSQLKAPAFLSLEDGAKVSRRSKATNLYYTLPEGATYGCWDKEGSGWGATLVYVAPWQDFTFKNMSENPTTNKWHFNYISSGNYRDLTENADEDGSYTASLSPGYYLAAPTLCDEQVTDSFTIGYPGAYWGADEKYASYFTRISVDSVTNMAFINDHGNQGQSGYGWGSLSTGYLYGTGTLDATSAGRGIGVCKAFYQDYPKPMSPLYVEDMYIILKSVTQSPLPEGGQLTLLVLGTTTSEEGKISQTGDTIATLTASIDDFALYGPVGSSNYSPTGKYQRYSVTFTQKSVDDFGGVMVEPFAIDQQFRVKVIGLDEEGVDVGIAASSGIDEEITGVDDGVFQVYYSEVDKTYNHYYTGSAIKFGFTAMFDALEVETTLSNGEDTIEKTNYLQVSDDGTQSAVVTTAGNLPGVYVYTAQPWYNGDMSEEYYYAEDVPEWVLSLNVDTSNFDDYNLNIVSATCEPLPAGTKGRYAELYIHGRGVKSEAPIYVIQGEVEISGVAAIKTEGKAANATMFNMAGQRVDNSFKGLVIKNGQKFMNK